MHIPLVIFLSLVVLGIAALIIYTQRSNRTEKGKWDKMK
jgi:hypothetical protein